MNAPVRSPVAAAPAYDPHIIQLAKPIYLHSAGGDARQIILRDPTAADFVAINELPFDIVPAKDGGTEPDLKISFRNAMAWLVALSGSGQAELEKLSKRDFLNAARQVSEVVAMDGADPKN